MSKSSQRVKPGADCPPWCVRDEGDGAQDPTRWHFGEVSAFGASPWGLVCVALNAGEPGAELWPPRVNVFHAGETHVTADDADALAATLTELAKQVHQTVAVVTA